LSHTGSAWTRQFYGQDWLPNFCRFAVFRAGPARQAGAVLTLDHLDRGDCRRDVTYLGETGTEAVAGALTVSVNGGEVDRA
jgi:hypothetical protein